ncbi:MAG: hypothetical protein NC489_40840 [Ruminococcus flavefaciens]|nr:hypothetical protein [Ruminococcus flavefaciens]
MEKCKINIKREVKVSFGGRRFGVLVDGLEVTTIGNGETTSFMIESGQHEVSIAIGKKVVSTVPLNLAPGADANMMCYIKGNGAILETTAVDVSGFANPQPPVQPVIHVQSAGHGCLVDLICGLLILFGVFLIICAIFS